MIRTIFLLLTIFLLISCKQQPDAYILEKEKIDLNLSTSFRGISVFDEDVWISGTNATVVHYDSKLNQWKIHRIAEVPEADFRDVEALNDSTAVVISSGFPALIYKTLDSGETWKLVYLSQDSAVFLDAVEFWNDQSGLIFGDPVDGRILILKTIDAGEHWSRISLEHLPKANEIEGGFAASGSCLSVFGDEKAWIGVGGDQARVYLSKDQGKTWVVVNTPVFSGAPMRGIYSIAFKDALNGIAVGGEWRNENPPNSRAYTTDGGKTWKLGKGVDQYRSGSSYFTGNCYLASGLTGTDISYDGGENWSEISDLKLHGIEFERNSNLAYGMGSNGEIYRIRMRRN